MDLILTIGFIVLFIIWAIRIEANSNKTVEHLNNIEDLLRNSDKGKK